ncbi:MAG: hypothetical protein P8Y72_17940 [Anaerolineales bacterium]
MIENDRFKPTFWRIPKRDGQQTINLVPLRDIADQVLVIVGAVGELFFKSDLAAADLQVPQILVGVFFADLEVYFRSRRSRGDRAGW